MKKNNKGFTLMEMLIVVAIIAILVAISIPTFTSQLEKSREATDMANIRAAYAEVTSDLLLNDQSSKSIDVTAAQKQADWVTGSANIGGMNVAASTTGWTVAVNADKTGVTITAK